MNQPATIHSQESGTGESVLFVHGWLNDSTVWGGVVAELSQSHRCIAVDLRGHGDSVGTGPGTYGRDLVLDDLRSVIAERCDGGPVTVVGHSLGGYLALALAIENPELVAALGLVAAGPGFRNPESREQWNSSVRATAADRELPPGQHEISMHVDSMVLDRLSEIELPAAVVVGERDKRFIASADVFDKYLHVAGRTVVPDAGHMVHVKQPSAVAEALRCVL